MIKGGGGNIFQPLTQKIKSIHNLIELPHVCYKNHIRNINFVCQFRVNGTNFFLLLNKKKRYKENFFFKYFTYFYINCHSFRTGEVDPKSDCGKMIYTLYTPRFCIRFCLAPLKNFKSLCYPNKSKNF